MFTFGYIDLGTGSFILQAAIAAIVAIPFVLKSHWKKITGKLKRR